MQPDTFGVSHGPLIRRPRRCNVYVWCLGAVGMLTINETADIRVRNGHRRPPIRPSRLASAANNRSITSYCFSPVDAAMSRNRRSALGVILVVIKCSGMRVYIHLLHRTSSPFASGMADARAPTSVYMWRRHL